MANIKFLKVVFNVGFYLIIVAVLLMIGNGVLAEQNASYHSPSQCNNEHWYIGLPDGIACSSKIETQRSIGSDPIATAIFGGSSRLRPDLISLNKFCQQYTDDSSSYATYGWMHNYCNKCDQQLSYWNGSSWITNKVCEGTLNVQKVICATNCGPICTSHDSKKCVSNSVYWYDSCGNMEEPYQNCSLNQICENAQCKNVACTNENVPTACGINGYFGSKSCSADASQILQPYKTWSCQNPGQTTATCLNTVDPNKVLANCINGQKCDPTTLTCQNVACTDKSQCGTDGYIGSPTCGADGKVHQNYKTYTCNSPGTTSSSCINSTVDQIKEACTYGCNIGSCVPLLSGQAGVNPNPAITNQAVVFYANPTGGTGSYTYYWAEACTGTDNVCTNSFGIPGIYYSYLLVTSGTQTMNFSVPVIVNQACTPNYSQKCDPIENKIYNYDSCGNKGTIADDCGFNGRKCNANDTVCKNVACTINSQCGTDGYVDSPVCQTGSNNVFQSYKTYTCNNPGTTSSSCAFTTNLIQKTICGSSQHCYSGACIENLTATAFSSPNPGLTNQTITFTAIPTGGTGSYTYYWAGDCVGSQATCTKSFTNPGTYTALVSVVSGGQTYATGANVVVNPACTPNTSQKCVGNSIYNFNSCNVQGSLVQNCASNQLCENAQCKNVTCTNENVSTACGTNGFVDNPVCQSGSNNIFQNYKTWTCQNPGTTSSQCVSNTNLTQKENCPANTACNNGICQTTCISHSTQKCVGESVYWFDSCDNQQEKVQDCSSNQYCYFGACINNLTATAYASPNPGLTNQTITFTVMPSGGTGDYQYIWLGDCAGSQATCTKTFSTPGDYFANVSVISGGQAFGTGAGVKINSPCTPNFSQKCVGNSIYNYDSCGVQGTKVSDCATKTICTQAGNTASCQPIACRTGHSEDCPATTYSNPFCQNGNNNVFWNKTSYTCQNPDTTQSSCQPATTIELKENCTGGQICNNGSCACTPNASQKCGTDNKIYQFDSCGVQSTIVVKNCSDDNGYTGNRTCGIDGKVHQTYRTFNCSFGQTSCVPSSEDRIIETCNSGYSCDQGQCKPIACTIANTAEKCGQETTNGGLFCKPDGNVYQKYNVPTCLLPGTVNSSCQTPIPTEDRLQTTCTNGCQNGACIPVLGGVAGANPNPALTDQTVTFFVNPTGGTGNYTYNWTGACTGQSSVCVASFATSGIYASNLTVTSGSQTKPFSVSVIVNPACQPNSSQKCVGNSIYNYDSCGVQGTKVSDCATKTICTQAGNTASCQPIACRTGHSEDCPAEGYIDNPFCQEEETIIFQNFRYYTCQNPDSPNSICQPTVILRQKQECSGGQICNNGSCVCTPNTSQKCVGNSIYNFNSCNVQGSLVQNCASNQLCENAQCKNVTCTNENVSTACGTNGFVDNPVCQSGSNNIFQNYKTWTCQNPGTTSSQCVYNTNLTQKENCPANTACNNGICQTTCTANYSQKCVGNSIYNFNSCNEQGSLVQNCASNQLCENAQCKNVTCTNENVSTACGTNGFVDNPACGIDGKVHQNYQTFFCSNPGATNSYCSNTIVNQVIETCNSGYSCDQGQCKPIACTIANTAEKCGQETTNGGLFCKPDGNVYQKYNVPTCLLPGTVNSSCQTPIPTEDRLQTTCTNGCQNGACLSELIVSAFGSPVSATTGQVVTFNSTAMGGTGIYSYNWSNACIGSSNSCSMVFSTPGTYTANLTVTSGTQTKTATATVTVAQNCATHSLQNCVGNSIYWFDSCNNQQDKVQDCSTDQKCFNAQCVNNLAVTATANPNPAQTGQTVSFVSNASGGTGNYTYNWTGACTGTSSLCVTTFTNPGTYMADLSVTSGTQTQIAHASVIVNIACTAHSQRKCIGESVFWFDSCNNQQELAQDCRSTGQTCINAQCVNDLTVTTSVNPNPVQTNQTVTFTSNVSGGTGTYSYTWTGACLGSNNICTTTFANAGTYTANLSVVSGSQTAIGNSSVVVNSSCLSHASQRCVGNAVYYFNSCDIQEDLKQTCATYQICQNGNCMGALLDANPVAIPSSATTGNPVTFVANASGGNGSYAYSWTGDCVGTNPTCFVAGFNAPGRKTVNLVVNSGSQTVTKTIQIDISLSCQPRVETRCDASDSKLIYYYDSCGNRGDLAQTCVGNTICNNGQCQAVRCSSKPDCGQDGFVDGLTCGTDGNVHQQYRTWTCNNPGATNSSCTSTLADQIKQTCTSPAVCQSGACITPNITCTTNSQCGTDSDTGAMFCQSGNVYQNRITWTCNNPGATNSSCSSVTTQVQKQTCSTTQTCNSGSCVNQTITCSSNSQCGSDGYVDSPFCQNGNVWQNYKTFVCNNQGTINSFCANSTAPQQKTVCTTGTQTCNTGACVAVTPNLTVTAATSPNPATTTQAVTFTATPSGGTGTYTYTWSGDCIGTAQTCQKLFTTPGNYAAIVNVTSGSQTTAASANVTVQVTVTTPSVQTNSATNITTNSATLNGNITSLGGASSASVWFEWGTGTSYGNSTTQQILGSLASFTQALSGLASGTTYHYRAVTQNSNSIAYGADTSFTTTSATPVASTPIANAGSDQYVNTGQTVVLQGSGYDPNGQAVTYSWTCNGGYLSNPNIAQPIFTSPNVNFGANYICTLTVRNTSGLTASDDMTVRINYVNNNIIGNTVQTNPATNITASQATLNGYLNYYNSNTNSNNYGNNSYGVWFQYGTSVSYGQESNHQVMNSASNFSQNIANLQPNTMYHFRAVAQDNYGQLSYGQDMTFQTIGGGNMLTITKTVRNMSSGVLNWSNSVTASPGDVLNFMIVLQANGSQSVNNVTIRDILPGNLVNRTNVAVDNVVNYGDLNNDLNIGYVSAGQTRTISYQVQVAPAVNFSYGATTLTNSATVSSADVGYNALTASASVIVNKTAVLGATSVSTGLTNNIWLDSFFLPLLLAGLGLWGYKSGILGIDEWVARRKNKTKDFRAAKKLKERISEIKGEESGWPTL